MTARPPALNIAARTPNGAGLALPLAKALAHLMVAHAGCVRDNWPLTTTELKAEITEAVHHISTLSLSHDLFTEDLRVEIQDWTDTIASSARNMIVDDPAAAPSPVQVTELQELIELTWALLTVVDREITGLPDAAAEPGTRP